MTLPPKPGRREPPGAPPDAGSISTTSEHIAAMVDADRFPSMSAHTLVLTRINVHTGYE